MQDQRPIEPLSGRSGDERDVSQPGYELVFDRVFERVRRLERLLAHERQTAPALVRQLLPHPQPRRLLMVRNSARFCSLGLCEELLRASREARFDSATGMGDLAELGLEVASRLKAETYGAATVEDLLARALCDLGNARRLQADFIGSEKALDEAEVHLRRGSGDAMERGLLLRMRANLAWDCGRFDRADALADSAISLYRTEGLDHELGLGLMLKSHLCAERNDVEDEIHYLRQALPLVDVAREPRVKVMTAHNLAAALHDLGRNTEALGIIFHWRPFYFEFGDRALLARLHWLEGMIAGDMGRGEVAEGALKEARRGFSELSLPFDVALVSLELAGLYLEAGRTEEVQEVVAETIRFFHDRQIHREALAALMLFREAVQREEATVSLAHEIARFLERAKRNPEARFAH